MKNKLSYPNDTYGVPDKIYDTNKWIETAKHLYYLERNGNNRRDAIQQCTNDWNVVETEKFIYWLRFYEEGNHMKYKTAGTKIAQNWYESNDPGYFLQLNHPKQDTNHTVDLEAIRTKEKEDLANRLRYKLLGRFDSIEKLLRSSEGQSFAGAEFESLLEAIYNLKKRVQLINKISKSAKIYQDVIIREANVLMNNGFVKAAGFLYKFAEDKNMADLSAPASPDMTGGVGTVSNIPSHPDQGQVEVEENPAGINGFLKNLETGNITVTDEQEVDDIVVDEEELEAKAQVQPNVNIQEPELEVKEDIEVPEISDNEPKEVSEDSATKDFDSVIDEAFENLTVADIVHKLEGLAKIFKTREIPRQLAMVDMMLDKLHLSTYFPGLSEATNKALDSNNYIITRVEDMLSKLRGGMEAEDIKLVDNDAVENNSEVNKVQNHLQSDINKEQKRKDMRKKVENDALEEDIVEKETPEIEVQEDLKVPEIPVTNKPAALPQAVK